MQSKSRYFATCLQDREIECCQSHIKTISQEIVEFTSSKLSGGLIFAQISFLISLVFLRNELQKVRAFLRDSTDTMMTADIPDCDSCPEEW